jgi:hypothetical protein
MADTLVERVTGQASASVVPVEVQLVMTSDTPFATGPGPTDATTPNPAAAADAADPETADPETADPETADPETADPETADPETADPDTGQDAADKDGSGPKPAGPAPASAAGGSLEPALLPGWGPVPAELARELVAAAGGWGAAWVRRLFAGLAIGEPVGTRSRRRLFPAGLARFVEARDHRFCQTPWCNAPIRHLDHVVPHPEGGPTSADDGQGFCQQCNRNRQAPGWTATRRRGRRRTLDVTTPTGHTYPSSPPRAPGAGPTTGRPPRDAPRRTRSPTRTAAGRRRAEQ